MIFNSHLHKPYKSKVSTLCQDWLAKEHLKLLDAAAQSKLTPQQLSGQKKDLLSLPRLRKMSVVWNQEAMNYISNIDILTRDGSLINLISKGWVILIHFEHSCFLIFRLGVVCCVCCMCCMCCVCCVCVV